MKSRGKKSLIGSVFFLLFLLLASNANSEVEPVYAGWTVGGSWNGYGTILRSTDSGNTWTRQGAGQIADVEMGGVFAVDPYTAWVVGLSDNGYATIYHTTDGGTTWERKGSSTPASADYVPDVDLCKVHAVGDDVWAVSKGAILHSSDGGATWTAWMEGEQETWGLQGVYTLDGKTVWVTGGTRPLGLLENNHGIVFKTINAGQTWARYDVVFDDIPDFDAILGISAVDADTAWAVGANNSLMKTNDGGATWERDTNFGGLGDLNEVYAVNSSTVWVAGDDSIFWTTDGGQTWDSSAGLLPGGIGWMGISAISDQKAWASYNHYDPSANAVIGYIASTTNGGTTWTMIEQLNDEDLPGMNNISFATLPINLYDMIISLIEDVEQLMDDDFMNKGQGNALIVKLEKVLDRRVNDRFKNAVNVLNAFLNQVDAFVLGGVLLPEDGQYLSDQVDYIIELLYYPL